MMGELYIGHNQAQPVDINLGLELAVASIREKLAEQPVVLVAVAGGSATGKTSYVTPYLAGQFPSVSMLSEDNYCLGNSFSARLHGVPNLHVFDDYDPGRIFSDLNMLKQGIGIQAPLYGYEERERRNETITIPPARVVIMEGCYLLQPAVSGLFDVCLFLDTDDHSRFIRRIVRPRRNPNQTDTHRIKEYCELSYPGYHQEIAPYQSRADIILSNPYSVDEAMSRLSDSAIPLSQGSTYAAQQYWHPIMQPTELVSVAVDENSIQHLEYIPDVRVLTRRMSFAVPLGEYSINLSRIGYTPLESDLAA